MSLTSFLYRWARFNRDVNAVRRGPHAVAKRYARKVAGRAYGRLMNRVIR